ncbi:hypothetical protein SELMODRAFT_102887 [Selaginella moellendorffii]|uniref:Bet v I/Major latex protein domain-containing protein n=1 Tax=Selaginella moellendorffii TaxID=88036 RepID=D8RV32_SELML|nr:hypothetical protein SELMODRAFT_128954 [Selaginella moellendorffii]EFJ23889.1 hypothetical protein SELMODRAFT_102887 [Selaginella moellendorffii]
MVTTTFEDVELNASSDRLWNALKDSSNLFPKIIPDKIKSIELLEGTGGTGSVRLLTFGPAPYVKEKVEFVDEESKTMTVSALEGGAIGQHFTSFKRTAAFKPGKDDTTTLLSISVDYEPIGEPPLEQIKSSLVDLLKAEEAFLQANADAYTV